MSKTLILFYSIVLTTIIRYNAFNQMLISKKLITPFDAKLTAYHNLIPLIIEILVMIPHPNVFFIG
jgi:hypothetical protein